ncbi:MAG: SDR family oxidoreductase [Gordonia sp. (in: high G+C Gram-positive bacteria)]
MTTTSSGDQRVALVTGGSRGLGREISLHLARSGYDVVVNCRRNLDHAEEVARGVRALGRRAIVAQADVEDARAVEAMFAKVGSEFGRLDALVANAAATSFKPMLELSDANVARTLNLVVGGFIRLVRGADPFIRPGGRIVGISGIDSIRYMPGHGLLGAAKAAMESLVRSYAVELGPRSITVNAVCPGGFETDSSRIWGGSEFAFLRNQFVAQSAVKDFGTVSDMAHTVDFLLTPGARFLTGQTIVVDGGLTANLGDLDPLNSATREYAHGKALS